MWSTLAAGGVAGAAHSTIIQPLEALQGKFRATDIIDRKYKNMWHYGYSKSRELGFRRLYAGWGLTFAKDVVGCALFFATFEYIKSQCYHRFIKYFYGQTREYTTESSESDPNAFRPHYALEPTFLMFAGITATIVQQAIYHPLENVQKQFYREEFSNSQQHDSVKDGRAARSTHHASYSKTFQQLVKGSHKSPKGWRFLYRGFFWETVRHVPSTSAGLVIFELVRRRYDVDAGL